LQSLKPTFASEVAVTLFKVAKAQSFNSITTPWTAALAAGISKRFKLIGWSAPSIWPDATRKARAYPILPAAPVMVMVTGFFMTSSRAKTKNGIRNCTGSSLTDGQRRLARRPQAYTEQLCNGGRDLPHVDQS
jgi:hypothetical protein